MAVSGGKSNAEDFTASTISIAQEYEPANNATQAATLTGWRLAIIVASLCLAVFLLALDTAIIATAIPDITDQFHSLNDVGWYASAYLLTTCAFQLFFGKLYTLYNIKWIFLAAIAIFELGSLICGVAPNSVAFIIGRAIAGAGASGIFSGALIIVANTIALEKRPIYTGLIGSMYGISSVAGPLLGGVFTDKVTWRWCFYINLPIGAVTIFFIALLYRPEKKDSQIRISIKEQLIFLDLPGTILFLPAVICVLLALQWGGSTYPWSNWRIILLLIFFVLLTIGFIFVQIRAGDQATIPPRIFKQRGVWAASLYIALVGSSFFIFLYYIPIWFQAIKSVSAEKSGIDNLPLLIALVVASIIAGATVTHTGYCNPWAIACTILISVGGGMISTWTPETKSGKWIGYQIIYGAGVGCGIQQAMITVQAVLSPEDVPIGTALAVFAEMFGGSLFVSVAENVFTNRLIQNIAMQAPGVDAEAIIAAGATKITEYVPPDMLPQILSAYNDALTQAFYVGTAMAALSILGAVLMKWTSVKGLALA